MQTTLKTIGFIGVGGIGRPMAEQLIKSGFSLIACDKRESALEPFAALGAQVTTNPSACAAADMVIVMVADDAQALSVVSGPDGLYDAIDPDHPPLVAIMSTVLPKTIEALAAILAGKQVHLVDAPVSGGAVGAAKGALTIMAGGDAADLASMAPAFEALSSRLFHCGERGAGAAIKILNNLMGITTQFLMTEVALIATRLDIDLSLLAEVMDASSGRNISTLDYEAQKAMFRHSVSDPTALKAVVDICRKDLRLAQTLAEQQDVAAPLLNAIAPAHRAIAYEDTLAAWTLLAR